MLQQLQPSGIIDGLYPARIAAGEEFKLLHKNDLDDFTLASPALVGDRMLIRTEHNLYSIRRKG